MKQLHCKVYISECTDPYRNLAAEELLLHVAQPDEVILYLWQNENTVVIGRNQNAWRECRLEALTAQNGRLARRLSGGGAVYHDMGNQNFTFIVRNELYHLEKQSDVICRAVRQFGIRAERNGRNDITVKGRKFSGNAYYSTKGVRYHHGTVLISSDLSRLGDFLTPSREKLQAKGVESVRSRVVNLCEFVPEITPEAMRIALVSSFEEIYACKAFLLNESVLKYKDWDKLTKHYGSRQWTLGRLSDFNQKFHTKLSFGEMELQLSVSEGVITDAVMYSDAMDADWVEQVAKKLRGIRFGLLPVREALASMSTDSGQTEEFAAYISSVL